MKKIIIFLLFVFLPFTAFSQPQMSEKHGAIYVESAEYAEVEELFSDYDYKDFGHRDLKIPRIYLKSLPRDWENIEKSDDKNRTFIKILLPLIMKINEELDLERLSILNLQKKINKGQSLNDKERKFVEKKAEEYDVFTRNQEDVRYKIMLSELAEKVDELPPSFLIAVAGVYSDWGNSRLAIKANSLFREELWYSDEGIAPEGVVKADFTYRKFDSLEDSLRSYIHKVNSNITYRFVWAARSQMREIGTKVVGQQIITAMAYEGKLKNIVGMLDFNLSYYKLNKTDINPTLENVR